MVIYTRLTSATLNTNMKTLYLAHLAEGLYIWVGEVGRGGDLGSGCSGSAMQAVRPAGDVLL